jgi:short subunit dehydrogenase-like uncharacterized protein
LLQPHLFGKNPGKLEAEVEHRMPDFMIYGANGYTGSLIAREAVRRGMRPILGGRQVEKIRTLAGELGLDYRTLSLDAPSVAEGIRGLKVILHCAGPFSRTSQPMVDACLQVGAHYLDITGEEAVFEALAARDAEAKSAGIALLPGVGFDVVPSDCLAVHLKRRLPSATQLALGFQGTTAMSRGTALTVVEGLPKGGMVRENGDLRRVPSAWKTRVIDFGIGPAKAITIPWGDVSTAFHSTGIANIEVYTAAPWATRVAARMSRGFGWLLGSRVVQGWLQRRIHAGSPGPTDAERSRRRTYFWGEATDEMGHRAVTRLQTPDAYDLTVLTSLAVVDRVLNGAISPGFQTPGLAFGPDFILAIAAVTRVDEPIV